jgi:hypothetical protein
MMGCHYRARMKRLLMAVSMPVVSVYADDIRTNDGTVYKNAKITDHGTAEQNSNAAAKQMNRAVKSSSLEESRGGGKH